MNNDNKFLILNFGKILDWLYSNIYKEIIFKKNNKFNFNGFTFNYLLKWTFNLINNDFAYFPKLKLMKLNKFDKSRSEVQSYLKELFFSDNLSYLDIELMKDELESIDLLKHYVDKILSNNNLKKLNKSEELLKFRWYLIDFNKLEIDENTSDFINKTISYDNSKLINYDFNEEFLLEFYNFFSNYFLLMIKFFEIKLINNLNNQNELLIIFNNIWQFYSKLIIIIDEILTPLNKLIDDNFNTHFNNLPKYPKFSYFKFLIKLFYNKIFLNYKNYLEKSFFKLLKNKKLEIIKRLNKTIEKNNTEDNLNKNLKEYITFLEDISYNEININFNCFSDLNCENEIDFFREKLINKSIKFLNKNFDLFLDDPSLINKFFNLELSLISEIALENIYKKYVDKIGKLYLKNIRKNLTLIANKSEIKKEKNDDINQNILNVWLKRKSSEFFFKNDLNKIFYNFKNTKNDSEICLDDINLKNVNYLYNKNKEKFKDLVDEFNKIEKLCDNIFLKMKTNDKLIIEFNNKRGIPFEIGEMKNLYDFCSNNFDKKKLFKTKIEEVFIDDDLILNNTYCSIDLNDKIDFEIKKFNLPGYEKIIDEEEDDSFEELKL